MGVAKQANLREIRALNCQGEGTISTIVAGVSWLLDHVEKPAVASMSIGGSYSQSLNDAAISLLGKCLYSNTS